MSDTKISALPAATTPLAGTEVAPIVQSGTTKQVSIANILSATQSGGTANGVQYLNGSKVSSSSSGFRYDGTNVLVGTGAYVGVSSGASIVFDDGVTGSVWNNGGSAVIKAGGAQVMKADAATKNVTIATGNVILETAGKGITDSTSTVSLNFKSTAAYLSGGDFYIGTANALSSTARLQISNGTGRAIATAGSTGDTTIEPLRIGKFDNDSTTSQLFVRFTINNDGAGSGQINANGASAAAFGTYSDARLKENVVSLPTQLENICALRPVEFDYKDGSGHQIGFIAQEMQQIYPDVVSPGDGGMLTVTGWSKTEARLVRAIQEQQSLIEALTAKVFALEQKVG